MIRLTKLLSFVFLGVAVIPYAFSAESKECVKKLPPALVITLERRFKDLQIPRLADLDQRSVAFDISQGGDGCFTVAAGDFFGSKTFQTTGIAVLLVPKKGGTPQLIVARQMANAWKLYRLPTFCDAIASCYVKSARPGIYSRSEALDTPPVRPDERERLISKTAVVMSGRLESTGIVYAYSGTHWLFVWVSD
jgi:hypothetical protein